MSAKAPAPRKRPVQSRSRQTVATILQATAQVLVQRGYDRTTTNAVAERAGVSIGSLYEYFPNKEALVAALAEAHVADLIERVDSLLVQAEGQDPPILISSLIQAGMDAHRADPALHKVLVEQVPRIGALADAMDVSTALQQRIAVALSRGNPTLPDERIRLLALVIETCIEGLTHRAVLDEPEWLASGHVEREAQMLLEPYVVQALRC